MQSQQFQSLPDMGILDAKRVGQPGDNLSRELFKRQPVIPVLPHQFSVGNLVGEEVADTMTGDLMALIEFRNLTGTIYPSTSIRPELRLKVPFKPYRFSISTSRRSWMVLSS